jgi:NurA-like 5'-3' nuclease
MPAPVLILLAQISSAKARLLIMPGFNYAIPGSLLSAGVRDADGRDEVLYAALYEVLEEVLEEVLKEVLDEVLKEVCVASAFPDSGAGSAGGPGLTATRSLSN